jgi:hypothetical protein
VNIVVAALEIPYFHGGAEQALDDRCRKIKEQFEKASKVWLPSTLKYAMEEAKGLAIIAWE